MKPMSQKSVIHSLIFTHTKIYIVSISREASILNDNAKNGYCHISSCVTALVSEADNKTCYLFM